MNRLETPERNGAGYALDERGVGAADPLVKLGLIPEPQTIEQIQLRLTQENAGFPAQS
jgi:hypothetical protein